MPNYYLFQMFNKQATNLSVLAVRMFLLLQSTSNSQICLDLLAQATSVMFYYIQQINGNCSIKSADVCHVVALLFA